MPGTPADYRVQPAVDDAVANTLRFPRLRYMGSKYRLIPYLAEVFSELGGRTALDAFSGSGVVAYLMKRMGYSVTTNDFLNLSAVVSRAVIVNGSVRLSAADISKICGPPADDRNFISNVFDGLYFNEEDRRFLYSAWSHIDTLRGAKRDLAISALILACARKQPRGVFTFTDLRYDDGRRDLHIPLSEHFAERAEEYNDAVFRLGSARHQAIVGDVFDLPDRSYDLVYLDPPYAPPRDDNCYIKRYHFLEGLSVYWRGMTILENTKTKKLAKKYTPFSYKHSIVDALRRTLKKFKDSNIVLSYSSNAVPTAEVIHDLIAEVKRTVEVRIVNHKYSFGTHGRAQRRDATEYIFIGR